VFASLVSYGIKTWTWHRYRVYIDIQALQISLLGGRVFFTGLRYHGNNETLLVQNGYITWCYWLRRVRQASIFTKENKSATEGDAATSGGSSKTETLPCRITVSLIGLEWFVYNRSAAYDSILDGILGGAQSEEDSRDSPLPGESHANVRKRRSRALEKSEDLASGHRNADSGSSDTPLDEEKRSNDEKDRPTSSDSGSARLDGEDGDHSPSASDLPLMLQLFPIHVQCEKAALVMGNENTKAILIVKAGGLSGDIDASETHASDPYRQIFKIQFRNPVIEMKDNQDYKEDQTARTNRERQAALETEPVPRKSLFRRYRRQILGQLRNMVPYWRKSVESFSVDSRSALGTATSQVPGSSHWQGLSRYLDDREQDDKTRWATVEYAAVSTIVDSPEATLTVFWDVVGKVTSSSSLAGTAGSEGQFNVNGDDSPAWGINLAIKGGMVNYGPWADRQRADLQRVFFPTLCKDAVPATRLPAGAERTPTQFKLYVQLDEEVRVRIPIREESKNWRWKGKEPKFKPSQSQAKRRQRTRAKKPTTSDATQLRPAGWLDIKVAQNATISYSMDMLAGPNGYANTLNLDLPSTELSSSVNHETLWRSGPQRISCDLSAPLKWNGLRSWRFNIIGDDLELFLLRDHVFLLIDLVDDWASGPPPEYLMFTPFKYYINLELRNLKLYLNVNDANIINRPTDFNDNTYLIISSPSLLSTACIPINQYRPPKNSIPFDVRAEAFAVGLHVPPWNTQAAFLSSKEIGHGENLLVEGHYHFNATTSPANTDTLVVSVSGQSPSAYLYGFVVRYFLKVKDNYFGDDIHFKTLEEHQELLQLKETNPSAELAARPPPKKSNDLDVILTVRVDDPRILLPANLYSSKRYIQAEVACLSADARFTNYYMDLDVVLTPLNISLGNSEGGMETPISATTSTQLFVDGLHVLGHRLFGLPPTEPTYLCNWDLSVGAVTGECTTEFMTALMGCGQAFAFSFDDDENALISYSSIIFYDVTFLRVMVESVSLWLHADEAAFLLSTGTISVKYNDWARTHYSKRANINIPDLQFSCVNSESAARHKSRSQHPVETEAFVKTSIQLATISRKFDFSGERKLQQELVRREDQRTHRTGFLIIPGLLDELVLDVIDIPAQCVPPVPLPAGADDILDDKKSFETRTSTARSHCLRQRSSFLSLSGTSESSILRPRSSMRSHSKSKEAEARQLEVPGASGRPGIHQRGFSASTGRHSAFYSAVGDIDGRETMHHSSVAFASQYFAPYFPLESVRPDTREATLPSIEKDDGEDSETAVDPAEFGLEDIDPESLTEDHLHSSTIVEFSDGLTGFFSPHAVRYLSALISALQPCEPEDMLDTLQVQSMQEILDLKKLVKVKGEIKDLFIRIPRANIRFLNSSTLDSPAPSLEEKDQYDLAISKVSLVTRSTTTWQNPFNPETKKARTSLHLRMGSTDLSASERLSTLDNPQAAVMAHIDHVMVSMGTKDVTYLDVDIGAVTTSTASGKIEYLASLIHRTNVIASDLGTLLAETTSQHANRMKYFIHRLVIDGSATSDPSFLIRPSAVLRSAPEHLRTFDSWKLAIRLRQIWSTMHANAKDKMSLDCVGTSAAPPGDVKDQVVSAFQRWRSWDLDDLSESVLLKNIFGPLKGLEQSSSELDTPLMMASRVREVELFLDHGNGPKQNKITFLDLTARLERKPRQSEDPEIKDIEGLLSMFNVYCGEARVSLNWDLLELVEDVLKLYKHAGKDPPSPPVPAEDPVKGASEPQQPIHVVLELGRGSLELDTVNLSAKSLCHGLKTSLLLHGSDGDDKATNFVLSCDAVTSRLRNHSQVLGMFQLREPSVFLSHELHKIENKSCHTIKTTASSHGLTLDVKQDPVVLLEVVNVLIKDEIAQLYRLKHQLPSSPKPKKKKSQKIVERMSAFRVNVALFLDEYNISLLLLQSMTYNISGVVARAAMAANFGKEIIFDFDVKDNSHEVQVAVKNEVRSISVLRIPPTNGRITSHTAPTEHSVTVFASIEDMHLDASAVYSLLRALNRPQIMNTIEELQEQSRVVMEHIEDIFGAQPSSKPQLQEQEKSELVYAVHLTLAGLEVFGNMPLESNTEPLAYMAFSLDRVHLEVANRHDSHGPILTHPELHVNLRKIMVDIQRGTEDVMRSCGSIAFGVLLSAGSRRTENGKEHRSINFKSDGLEIILSPETVSTVVDALGYMGDKIKDLDTSRELDYLRNLRKSKPRIAINDEEETEEEDILDSFLSSIVYQLEVRDIRISWLATEGTEGPLNGKEDLVLAIQLIEFGTRKTNAARLTIENFQLQMVPPGQDKNIRSLHSALLPEVVFNIAYVSTADGRRLAFQAVGKSLDLRLTSGFIIPAANLQDSISLSVKNVQQASQHWNTASITAASSQKPEGTPRRTLLGTKRLESLLIDAEFAGAVVYISGKKPADDQSGNFKLSRQSTGGKYGQFNTDDSGSSALLRTPGLAWKLEYRDNGKEDPSLYGEIQIDASSNVLYPSVVPLIMDMTSSVKEVVTDDADEEIVQSPTLTKPKSGTEDNILTADPSAVLGRLKLNLGLRICRQEFSLSCQPIARVAATAAFEDVYVTFSTVRSADHGNFFAISAAFTDLHASVQHVYSRESTGSFEVESIVLSLMNSKHVSGTSGVSAILKVSPMKVSINAKQLQDFLLFREIWYPSELRQGSAAPVAKLVTESSQGHLVQRYQQVAATAAFPWTATVSISSLEINVDLGQAIGKSVFAITDFWISSKKTSDWEQDLCLGFEKIGVDCTGRLSGFVALQNFKLRTSIQWPAREKALNETPLIQASIGFSQFRLKAAFDYQAFLVADITTVEFLMYNVRRSLDGSGDRLVAIFDGEAVQIFGTTTSAAQGVALYQAFQKLIQERKANFETSLNEIEKFMKRQSLAGRTTSPRVPTLPKLAEEDTLSKSPISLDTDVVVTLKALNLGVFPSTFSDHQVFKMEALNAQARFAASIENRRIHSTLGLTLGQLRIGLAGVRNIEAPKTLSEISVEDVVQRATGSRGGTILKVPKVEAVMQTWQVPDGKLIEYIFKSDFEGKVEVGWNYSRISYIRGMWANHSKSLAQTWGRELPLTAIKVTGVPEPEGGEKQDGSGSGASPGQQKITAEVNVPQSKYDYVALEPPIIETPQLRDMGEATPPLEWIGLHRERLPNLTHQIVIVSLLELAGEVEDAYSRILGSS
jgi:hypothetical protein